MFGAVIGDIAGSIYENIRIKRKNINLFGPLSFYTDDTVLTIAVADALMNNKDYADNLKKYARRHLLRGYGPRFYKWILTPNSKAYYSYGNGAAMRVSPVAYAFDSTELVLQEAKKTALCTHNHPEGIKGAQAVAVAVFMARSGATKPEIKSFIETRFNYDLSRSLNDIRPNYKLYLSAQRSVPEAIISFLEATDFEDSLRNAISLGGDSDTLASIAGAIAEAFFKEIPKAYFKKMKNKIPKSFYNSLLRFQQEYNQNNIHLI